MEATVRSEIAGMGKKKVKNAVPTMAEVYLGP
jgi:hypothetical protein